MTTIMFHWECVICYKPAPCFCVDVTLCRKHAKEYNFGYGKTLVEMKKEEMKEKKHGKREEKKERKHKK